MPETTAQNRLYIYEPNLIPQIVHLISCENQIPIDIQTYALHALHAIANHKLKLAEVLNSLNAATNHGILLHILRQLSNGSDTVSGRQMLSSAGIINACIHVIENEEVKPNIISKVITLLDNTFGNVENTYFNYTHLNGLDATVKALNNQVDRCITESKDHDTITLVKTILRFVIRMIKSSYGGSSLRNLMETNIPQTLIKIMDNHNVVGSTVFVLAISFYASFIHLEPTSLAVLQEYQVPQTFLKAFMKYNGYCDVNLFLNVIYAFSATCRNEQGLELFQTIQPLPHFFKLMTSSCFLKNPAEVSESDEMGGEIGDLVRRQPSLKGQVFSCVHAMLQQTILLGETEEPQDKSHILVRGAVLARTEVQSDLLSMIQMSSKFLLGFLEFASVKEFVNYKGHEILLKYFSLPMLPFDYHLTEAFTALSDVFGQLADQQTIVIIDSIVSKVRKSAMVLAKSKPSKESIISGFVHMDDANEDGWAAGNQIFREYSFLVGHVRLLANVISFLVSGKDDAWDRFMDWLYSQRGAKKQNKDPGFFELLGTIHRSLIYETILLRNTVPKTWYSKTTVIKKDGTAQETEEGDLSDYKVVNTRRFVKLLSGISPVIMPLLQSIIKLEPHMNRYTSEEEHYKSVLISRDISTEILKNFQWIPETFNHREEYVAAISALFSILILEDNEQNQIVSLVAFWFSAIGGVLWIVENLAIPYSQKVAWMISENHRTTMPELYRSVNSCLELLFPVLHHLSLPSIYSESILKEIADRDKTLEMLYPENWLLFVRSDILRVKIILDEPTFHLFPKHTICAILGCIKQCMYLQGERYTQNDAYNDLNFNPKSSRVKESFLDSIVSRVTDSISSPTPEDRSEAGSEDMSGIPEDDNDEDYEDFDDDNGFNSTDSGLTSFLTIASRLLTSSRQEIRQKLPNVLIRLVQDRSDVDFVVRDTLIALACGDPDDSHENARMMARFFEGISEIKDRMALFENCVNRIRIFALMLREPQVQEFVSEWVTAISILVGWSEFLDLIITRPGFPNPAWLTVLFFILETYIAQSENYPETRDDIYFEKTKASALIEQCIKLLTMNTLSEDNLLATLRILVRLTKRHSLAQDFLRLGGLEALLKRPRIQFDKSIRIQQAYVIMILRHVIETKKVLDDLMKEWLQLCSGRYNADNFSFEKKMKIAQPLFLRHPTQFINLVERVYTTQRDNRRLRYHISKSPEETSEQGGYIESKTVVHFLLNELVKTQEIVEENDQKLGYTGYLMECLLELVASYPNCKQDIISFEIPANTKLYYNQDMVPHKNPSILTVLLNILIPHGSLDAVTDLERKRKGIFIWTIGLFVSLCYDTSHTGNMRPSGGDEDEECLNDNESDGSWPEYATVKEERIETLTAARNHVMKAIAEFLEYFVKLETKSSIKYIKYYTLAELCHYILNSRQADINSHYITSPAVKEKNIKDLAKLMIDHNFVPLLINAIQDVNVNYPHAKVILNSLLRPLEKLAKMATRFELKRPYDKDEEQKIQERYYSVLDQERSTSPVENIDELYRNSSIAILDGAAVEENEENSSEFDSSDEDIEMASSGEEIVEDEDHEGDSEDDIMADLDNSEDEEDDADREMNELMRNHRHHLPDTDEEDSGSSEESLDEDDEDSLGSFEEESASEVYNSDMSDHVESDVEMDTNGANRGHFDDDREEENEDQIMGANSFAMNNNLNYRVGEFQYARDDIILHPLLRNFNHQTTNNIKESLVGNTSVSHLQPYEDIIGHSALLMLYSAISSEAGNNNIDQDSSQASTGNNSTTEPTEDADKKNKNVLHLLLEFSPVPTIERWEQVTQMVFINQKAFSIAHAMAMRLPNFMNIEKNSSPGDSVFNLQDNQDSQDLRENENYQLPSTTENHINVSFRGQEVEVNRNDIGLQFLDALPEDFRNQILNAEYEGEDGEQIVLDIPLEGLDPDFLAALPDDVRDGLLREEQEITQRRRTSSEEPEGVVSSPEQNQETDLHQDVNIEGEVQDPESQESFNNPEENQFLDVIRIVDKSQLTVLARLLFVPQSIVKVLLNRLLLNLCENTNTCDDLLSLLLFVLQDECSDLPAVDCSFSRLFSPTITADSSNKNMGFLSKTSSLISQRCLEILYYVLQMNWHSRLYFMTENEQFGLIENGKNKYSFSILIDLLQRPSFLNNSRLMEQLMEILSRVCRSIPNYIEYQKRNMEKKDVMKLPNKYFEYIVGVLTTNECSSRTFRFALSVLSSLSCLDDGFEITISSLKSAATQIGLLISKELKVVLSVLEKLKVGKQMEALALKQFSIAISQQLKLLRILNTTRFLYMKHKKERKDLQIYDDLDIQPLWSILGSCLTAIRDKEDLVDVVNIFLPLVECFMTVSSECVNTETASDQKTMFIEFTNEHKKILNIMVRSNPFLMNGSFSCLANVPAIFEFDNKRVYFSEILRKESNSVEKYPVIHLSVRREHTFEDTYEQMHELKGDEVRYGKLKVEFHDEEGVDEGGVSREWFSTLARQMFDPNYALFITSAADKLTYIPNRTSGINPDHLSYFKFVGRLIGKVIHDGRLLDAYFTRSFYKLILGRPVDYKDLEAVDPTYYKSLVWMLENDITNVIDLTFSVEVDDFGTFKIIDLKPDGQNISVTQENKHEYINLIASQRLVLAIKPQVDAFLEGFYEIIPYQHIKIFNEQELELLISGLPDIDIDDWKANTEYEGYNFQSPQIQWFWRAVRSFDEEERAKLLQFATGTSKVPLGGFSALQGSNGLQKFQIHKEFSDINRLPSAHTCFNQVDLPQYQTYDDLRRCLFKAISECSIGFGFV